MPSKTVIRCRGLVKGQAEGEALVAPTTLSFWGEVDPLTGRVLAEGHPLQGQCLGGKVLVIGLAHGEGNAPAAFVNTNIDALAVLGCVVNRIPMVAELDRDPFGAIETGDYVRIDADRGTIEVTKR